MEQEIIQLISSFFGAAGFSLIFNVEKKHLLLCSFGGVIAWGTYLSVFFFSSNVFLASLAGASISQIYAQFLAIVKKTPAPIFCISALIPLIPGGALYRTMDAAIAKNWVFFRHWGSITLQTVLGIALGISFVSVLLYIFRPSKK
jgi:uncharacterized membrane protein YjjB (DUF3815 family)